MPQPADHNHLDAMLSRREALLWTASFILMSAFLLFTGFTSKDPDSALYAALSERLAQGPPSHWIAPEWWGHWEMQGLFREHPIGIFVLPTLLGWLGIPAVQASYTLGLAAGLAAVMLVAWLTAQVTGKAGDGRALLVLLPLIPIAFTFRIRSNHEYPMLVCLLVALVGVDSVRRSWRGIWVLPLALCTAVLVKGVFVVIPLIAVGWWIILNPRRVPGGMGRPITALVASVLGIAVMSWGYDVVYRNVTGESFWAGYWARQLGPLRLGGTTTGGQQVILHHLGFYTLRLLWHPAPWSLALVAAAWRIRRHWRESWRAIPDASRRGLAFTLAFAATSVLMLAPSSRFAERYVFSVDYAVAAAGIVVALVHWPRLREALASLDRRVPALPVVCWTLLILGRLLTGPWLPRIKL